MEANSDTIRRNWILKIFFRKMWQDTDAANKLIWRGPGQADIVFNSIQKQLITIWLLFTVTKLMLQNLVVQLMG